jgi:uncharacterized protein (TIGR03083 family)
MDVTSWVAALRREGESLAGAAANVGMDAPVPPCPGWAVRDLLLHTGGVHRWAATIVGEARGAPIGLARPQDIVATPPGDAALVDWYLESHAMLVAAIVGAPEDLDCWTFMATGPGPLAFWARRQAHETAIHRVDAEAAAGRPTAVDPALAADGVDELLSGFLPRNRALRPSAERTLRISAADAGRHWLVRVGPNPPAVTETPEPVTADTAVTGDAAAVYLALWNRRPWDGLTVTGDDDLLHRWADGVQVRWA